MHTDKHSDASQWDEDEDLLAYYEEKFRLPREPRSRRSRKPKNARQRHEEHRAAVEELAANAGLEHVWETTYTPARFESGWLKDSLHPFYSQEYIVDVMAQVKGGKEANVYRCAAHPTIQEAQWLAAKVYRPRSMRNLRNDAAYREGRQILTGENGKPAKPRDDRILRAIGKKTDFGVQVQHTSWLMYEYLALTKMHQAGAAVPKPYAVGDNALLMAYVGDADRAAPTLHETRLASAEVGPLFQETLRNIQVMLAHGFVHGDLSAYNILYWEGRITLIDFPQVVSIEGNRNARRIFQRDVQRVCQYFRRYGVRMDARDLADELWQHWAPWDFRDELADLSRLMPPDEEA
ncbi:MAG: hypothetical protein D6790_17435 [Caldilineae bacterium]|nr:MAG: hypothetical protein D6790_17435 [Caldilineae bacterium]